MWCKKKKNPAVFWAAESCKVTDRIGGEKPRGEDAFRLVYEISSSHLAEMVLEFRKKIWSGPLS